MTKPYYILNNGKTSSSLIFGESYILITCGSDFEFNPNKIKKILSKEVSYSINLLEKSIVEIYYNGPLFFIGDEKSIKNIPSKLNLEEFICLVS